MKFGHKIKIVIVVILIFILCQYLFNHKTEKQIITFYASELDQHETVMRDIVSYMKIQDSSCNNLQLYYSHAANAISLSCDKKEVIVNVNSEIFNYLYADWESVTRNNRITYFKNTDSYKFYTYYLCYSSNDPQKNVIKEIKPNWFVIKGKNRFSL